MSTHTPPPPSARPSLSSTASRPLRVLISGSGIAGPVLSYWLTRSSGGLIRPVLVEKAPSLRTSGQHLDIHSAARPIVDNMGLTELIRERCTLERGTRVMGQDGQVKAEFPVGDLGVLGTGDGSGTEGQAMEAVDVGAKVEKTGFSPTNELEILRYELCKVFFEATEKTTEYRFGEWITGIDDSTLGVAASSDGSTKRTGEGQTVVTFASGRQEAFDVVVLADGMTSPTRNLVFGRPRAKPAAPFMASSSTTVPKSAPSTSPSPDEGDITLRSLGFHIAYFPIPWSSSFDTWSQVYWTTGGRVIWLRPDWRNKDMRVYLIARETARFSGYRQLDEAAQKALWKEHYQGAGWKTDEILAGMMRHTGEGDWYMQEVAQVLAPQWSKGRTVLLGDAASCPSPMSGMGTNGAITGAYVLGCELGRVAPGPGGGYDPTPAFEAYDRTIRPFMTSCQRIRPGGLRLFTPNSAAGIGVLNFGMAVTAYLTSTRLGKWATKGESKRGALELPKYDY